MSLNIYKKVVVILLIFCIVFFLTGCLDESETSKKITEFMKSYNDYSSYPYSGSILVAKKGEILLSKGYKMADYENDVANTKMTVFPIGSITKSFTSIAILQLCEKELIDLKDPVSKYINGYKKGDKMTIHQLLSHTSGLSREGKFSADSISLEENVEFIKKQALMFEPGKSFAYSNAGYILLAAIIEKVSNRTYSEYLEENILKPLDVNYPSPKGNGLVTAQ